MARRKLVEGEKKTATIDASGIDRGLPLPTSTTTLPGALSIGDEDPDMEFPLPEVPANLAEPIPEPEEPKTGRRRRKAEPEAAPGERKEERQKIADEGFADHVNGPPKPTTVDLPPELEGLMKRVLIPVEEIEKAGEELEEGLRAFDGRTEYGMVLKRTDEAVEKFRKAHHLLTTTQIMTRQWEVDTERTRAILWEAATAQLQDEKDAGKRNKTITDADVRARVASNYPDEYIVHEMNEAKLKRLAESFVNLVEAWKKRCDTLNQMLAKSRV